MHVGGAQLAIGKALGQIGRGVHLFGGDPAPQNRGSHVAIARLFLGMDADVIAIDVCRGVLGLGRIQLKSDPSFQFLLEVLHRPAMPQE